MPGRSRFLHCWQAIFIAALQPYLLRTDTNPAGLDGAVFASALAAAVKDRYAFFHQFYADVYNTDKTLGIRISGDVIESSWCAACSGSAYASVAAVITWTTAFRTDVAKIAGYDIGVLIVDGTHDRILPIDATARPLRALLLPRAEYVEIPGAPTVCCGPTPTTSTTNYWRSSPTEPGHIHPRQHLKEHPGEQALRRHRVHRRGP